MSYTYDEIKEIVDNHINSLDLSIRLDRMKAIALKLRLFRAHNRLSQAEFARKLGVTRFTVVRWENLKTLPNKIDLAKLQKMGVFL